MEQEPFRHIPARPSLFSAVSRILDDPDIPMEKLLEVIPRVIARVFGDICLIRLLADDRTRLLPGSIYHPNPITQKQLRSLMAEQEQPFGEGLLGDVARNGQPILIETFEANHWRALIGPEPQPDPAILEICSAMIVPLVARGEVMGILAVLRDHTPVSYTTVDLTLLQALADQIALVMENTLLAHRAIEAEHKEDEARALLEVLLAHTQAGIAIVDRELRCHWINSHLALLAGIAPDEPPAGAIGELLPALAPALKPLLRATFASETPSIEAGISGATPAHPDEQRHWLASCYPLRPFDRVALVIERFEQRRVEEVLQRQSMLFSLLQQVAVVANEANTLDDALQRIIGHICTQMGWSAGHAYVVADDDPDVLAPSMIWYLDRVERFQPFETATMQTRFTRGVGLPGRALDAGEVIWVDDVLADPAFARAPQARLIGIRAAVAVPVLIGDEVVAVLEFYAGKPGPPDPGLLEVLNLISIQFGRVAERQRERHMLERAREQSERANAAKSEFLSRMSHELRTPLNAILGFAQLLDLGDLTPAQREKISYIIKGGEHLLSLINEVLDLSRIEAGRLTIEPEPIHAGQLLAETLDLVGPLAAQQHVEVRITEEPAHDLYILADRQRARQVLLNLLSNAIKYNQIGGHVTISCARRAGPDLRIAVADTGPGIPSEKLPRLFKPFERLGYEYNGVEGTGLGLALSKTLVETMGGRIGVESVVGQGSVFWIELPIAMEPVEPQRQIDSQPPGEDVPTIPCMILYVEDNLSNFRLVQQICARRPGIQLLTATQGLEGLALARQYHPDLILLDLHLPDIYGDEVLMRLQADPATRDLPVIMISADAGPQQIERLRAAGAQAYLTKPLDVNQFLMVIDAFLEQRA